MPNIKKRRKTPTLETFKITIFHKHLHHHYGGYARVSVWHYAYLILILYSIGKQQSKCLPLFIFKYAPISGSCYPKYPTSCF